MAYAQSLMQDPALSWHDAVRRFPPLLLLQGKSTGLPFSSIEEQQALFRRLSKHSRVLFREKQRILFGKILEAFEIPPRSHSVDLFINLSLSVMVVCRAIPQSLPLFVPEAAEQTAAVQIELLTNSLETLRARRCLAARLTLPPAAPPSAAAAPPPSLSPAGRRAPPESDGSPPVQAVDFCSK